ncbi:MAG: hypothetical protein K2K16_04070 [Ruminococcus sp.]|nr:hypothetical protein [Ruminococcus sp.]
MFEYILGFFECISMLVAEIPPVAIFPTVIIILIIIIGKYRKSSKLKKHMLSGAFIFTGMVLLLAMFPVICRSNDTYFYNTLGFVYFYFIMTTICVISAVTLFVTYIVVSLFEKITLARKRS